jgi:signal transduction histidine kinase
MHSFHLRKIVEELVDNAFKFSSTGQQVRLTVTQDDGELCIEVADQGRGMSQEQIDAIDAYVQFKRYIFEQQGAGVGLTLSKRLVELYGGTLQIESAASNGTTIRVRIPGAWVKEEVAD